ncbi:MAG: hypothetical protein LUG98_01570 [Tannerellaceae bacterium]|nr:hypothetical protein [Tannerellaceae bacterium]
MSQSSAVTRVTFRPKGGTYIPVLTCPSGDIYQAYQGGASNGYTVIPDWEADTSKQPIVYFVATSSRVAEGIAIPTAIEWYYNSTKLSFDNTGLCTTTNYINYFQQVSREDGIPGLKILKNLVVVSGLLSGTITAKATVSYGNITDQLEADYTVRIEKQTGSPYRVTIAAADDNLFTIRTENGSVKIKAVVYDGDMELTTGLTYKWYRATGGSWTQVTTLTTATVTITADMVDSYSQYKVEVFKDGEMLGFDTETIIDASDPVIILMNPTPENETIEDEGDTVKYSPSCVTRGDTSKTPISDFIGKFQFIFSDSKGNLLYSTTASGKTKEATATITYAMCSQANSDIDVIIMADSSL